MGIWIAYLVRLRIYVGLLASLGINIAMGMGLALLDSDRQQWPELDARLRNDASGAVHVGLFLTANLGLALLMKLYRVAVLEKATAAERLTGLPALRVWLSPLNVMTVVCLAVMANFAFGWSYLGTTMLGLGALLAYPLVNTIIQQPRGSSVPLMAPADERQRVLALVEAGKISAEDGAELLTALAQSQSAGGGLASIGRARRIILAGAAIVLLGFFMPWFTLNVPRAIESAQQMMPQFGSSSPHMSNIPGINLPQQIGPVQVNTRTQWDVHGGDVPNGLGWITLLLALGSASLPFFWTQRDVNAFQQRNASIIAMGAGSIALIYLLTNSLNAVTTIQPGFFMVLCGYVIVWAGMAREYFAGRGGQGVESAVVA